MENALRHGTGSAPVEGNLTSEGQLVVSNDGPVLPADALDRLTVLRMISAGAITATQVCKATGAARPASQRNRRLARRRARDHRRRGAGETDDPLPGSLHGKAPSVNSEDGQSMADGSGEARDPQRDRSLGSRDRNAEPKPAL